MWVVCKNYTVPFFYLHTDACLLAPSVKLATLVCWFRCKFLSGVVFPSSSLFFQPAGWWCLPLACKKKKKKLCCFSRLSLVVIVQACECVSAAVFVAVTEFHLLLSMTTSVSGDSICGESIDWRRLTIKQFPFHPLTFKPWEQGWCVFSPLLKDLKEKGQRAQSLKWQNGFSFNSPICNIATTSSRSWKHKSKRRMPQIY